MLTDVPFEHFRHQAVHRPTRRCNEAQDVTTLGFRLEDFRALDLQRHAHEPLLDRVWHLRENLTAYDAVYVALAEVLDCVLLTCDGPLSRAPGLAGRVVLLQDSR